MSRAEPGARSVADPGSNGTPRIAVGAGDLVDPGQPCEGGSHRTATAAIGHATYFHLHDLPLFRDHLANYIGPPASSCRKGVHRDPGDLMSAGCGSIGPVVCGGSDALVKEHRAACSGIG